VLGSGWFLVWKEVRKLKVTFGETPAGGSHGPDLGLGFVLGFRACFGVSLGWNGGERAMGLTEGWFWFWGFGLKVKVRVVLGLVSRRRQWVGDDQFSQGEGEEE
jgi:hypothetical protein